jgi:hypothetical protein
MFAAGAVVLVGGTVLVGTGVADGEMISMVADACTATSALGAVEGVLLGVGVAVTIATGTGVGAGSLRGRKLIKATTSVATAVISAATIWGFFHKESDGGGGGDSAIALPQFPKSVVY